MDLLSALTGFVLGFSFWANLETVYFILFVIGIFIIPCLKLPSLDGRMKGGTMNKNLKKIPKFNNEAAEREFWQKADSTKYVDFSKIERAVFPNLKLTSKPITLRLPQVLIERIKVKAYIKQILFKSLASS